MKLVLDQGYFPDGIMTAPSDEHWKRDNSFTKEMGFNGVRKHQKIEDPRYLYWADRMGLLVWEEMPSAYTYTDQAVGRVHAEWQTAIERDYNHPCIGAWVSIIESWSVPRLATDARQCRHVISLYHHVKSLDLSRLVTSNDGWEQAATVLCTIHNYDANATTLSERYNCIPNILAFSPDNHSIIRVVPKWNICAILDLSHRIRAEFVIPTGVSGKHCGAMPANGVERSRSCSSATSLSFRQGAVRRRALPTLCLCKAERRGPRPALSQPTPANLKKL